MKNPDLFLVIIALALTLGSCKESIDSDKPDIIVGGIYNPLTELVQNGYNSQLIVGDSIYKCNKIVAVLYSNQPTSNQANFYISMLDTTIANFNRVSLEVFTPLMHPDDFFKKGTIAIDTINITHCLPNSSYSEFVYGVNARFTWDTIIFENNRFKGHGSLEFMQLTESMNYPGVTYPAQKVEFEFR